VFTIPPDLVGGLESVRFLADPVGASQLPAVEDALVEPGDEVTMEIGP
jgi:hypothetical protein